MPAARAALRASIALIAAYSSPQPRFFAAQIWAGKRRAARDIGFLRSDGSTISAGQSVRGVRVAVAVGIGTIGGIGRLSLLMPPMVPMTFLAGGPLKRIRGCAPFSSGRLPGENEAGQASSGQLFGLG